MASVPAICDSCGTIFPAFAFGGPGSFEMKGCKAGPCPRCGGFGSIQDATYSDVAGALRIVFQELNSSAQISHLVEVLQQSRNQGATPITVADRIEAESPEMSALASWIRQYLIPKNSGEVYGIIGVLLAAIAIWMSLNPSADARTSLTDDVVKNIVQQAVASAIVQTHQIQNTDKPLAARVNKKVKVGRNDRCPCNSGKKFKACCIAQ